MTGIQEQKILSLLKKMYDCVEDEDGHDYAFDIMIEGADLYDELNSE